jgi:hypothetical protein
LAKLGSEWPFIGPEPACSISVVVAKNMVKDWTREHRKYCDSRSRLKQAWKLIQGTSANKTKELLKLNRNQV